MKIEEQKVPTFNIGIKETARANIQASAKAFEILSSGLYSDAEFAIVREISANAWDSHKAAGYPDKPFKVVLPNNLDPRFVVRDYGVSMSHEFVMTRVNTYFDSTKNDSNDEIGGFGLGIKSVFSYASSFLITCYMDGRRRVYVYQVADAGSPEISLVSDTESDEPTGVEVSVPVQADSYRRFENAARKTFAFYKVKPEINIELEETTVLLSGDRWDVVESISAFSESYYVEMGGIAYPIPNKFHNHYWNNCNHQVFLRAKIGDVDVTPSREQLKMTDRTAQFINDVMDEIRNNIMNKIQEKIDSVKYDNYWDFAEAIRNFSHGVFKHFKADINTLTWEGTAYDYEHINVRRTLPKFDASNKPTQPVPGVNYIDHIQNFAIKTLHNKNTRTERYSESNYGRWTRFEINNSIIVVDEKSKRRVGRWMSEDGNPSRVQVVTVDVGCTAEVAAKLKEALLGFPHIVDGDTIEVTRKPRDKAAAPSPALIWRTGAYGGLVSTTDTVVADGSYYFPVSGRQVSNFGGHEIRWRDESDLLPILKRWLGVETIYFLNERTVARLEKNGVNVINAYDALKPILDAKIVEESKVRISATRADVLGKVSANYEWVAEEALKAWEVLFGIDIVSTSLAEISKVKANPEVDTVASLLYQINVTKTISEMNLPNTTIDTPNLDFLIERVPFVFALLRDSRRSEVLDIISEKTGWAIV